MRTEVAVGNLTLQRNDDRRYLIQMSQQTAIQLPALFSISKCQQSTNEKLQEIQDRLAHVDTEEPRSTTVALNVKPRNIQYCKNFCRVSQYFVCIAPRLSGIRLLVLLPCLQNTLESQITIRHFARRQITAPSYTH